MRGEIYLQKISLAEFLDNPDYHNCWSRQVSDDNFTLTPAYLKLYNDQNSNTFFYIGRLNGEIVLHCLISVLTLKIAGIPIRAAMLGAPKTNGKAFWYSQTQLSYPVFIASILAAFKREFSFHIFILREFYCKNDAGLLLENQKMGFLNHHALVKSFLDITAYPSFDDYFNVLPSKKRNYFRNILKCREKPEVLLQQLELNPELVTLIYPLYRETNARAKENRTAPVPQSVFLALCDSEIKTKVITYQLHHNIVAFGLMLYNSTTVKCLFTGFDYSVNKSHNLWYQIMLESIRFAIDNRSHTVDMGSSAAAMKDKFLAGHDDVYISVLLKNALLTALLKMPLSHLLKQFLKPAI